MPERRQKYLKTTGRCVGALPSGGGGTSLPSLPTAGSDGSTGDLAGVAPAGGGRGLSQAEKGKERMRSRMWNLDKQAKKAEWSAGCQERADGRAGEFSLG